jgi:DNA-binding NarL/FixJ family response regulator
VARRNDKVGGTQWAGAVAFEGNRRPHSMEALAQDRWRVVLVTRDLPPETAAEQPIELPRLRFTGTVTSVRRGDGSPSDPDLVVLDCAGAADHGLELLASTHRRWPSAAILLVGAPDDARWLASAMRLGARGALSGGADMAQIGAAAENIGKGELWFSRRRTREILALALEEQGAALLEHLDATPDLTEREREIGRLLILGLTGRVAAAALGISENAVASHVANLERKLRVHGRNSLAVRLASVAQARPG